MYQRQFEYAEQHPDVPECARFLELAKMYVAHADESTFGLVQACAKEIDALMATEAGV
jgi:hypothetical protein